MNVILIHGWMNTGGIFRRLHGELESRGHSVVSPSLKPRSAHLGIADLAIKVAALADERFGPDAPLAIVGFSMGGIVARYYVQCLGGHERTKGLFVISSPLRGTLMAYLWPCQGTRDMRPGSRLQRELDATCDCLSDVELHTYWTPLDLMIVPSSSSRWPLAKETRLWLPLHPMMPRSTRIRRDLCEKIDALDVAPVAG